MHQKSLEFIPKSPRLFYFPPGNSHRWWEKIFIADLSFIEGNRDGSPFERISCRVFAHGWWYFRSCKPFARNLRLLLISLFSWHWRGEGLRSFRRVNLLISASVLASLGLLENSSVILVASMLISPLMVCMEGRRGKSSREVGVLGTDLGDCLWILHSWSFVMASWSSVRVFRAVHLCVMRWDFRDRCSWNRCPCLLGFLIGLGTSVWETSWGSTTSFPTPEMKARYGRLREEISTNVFHSQWWSNAVISGSYDCFTIRSWRSIIGPRRKCRSDCSVHRIEGWLIRSCSFRFLSRCRYISIPAPTSSEFGITFFFALASSLILLLLRVFF